MFDDFLSPRREKIMFVKPARDRVAVLERVDPDRSPNYVVSARTKCLWCDAWCWLGDKTASLILASAVSPMCFECAKELVPGNAQPLGIVRDTLWDGPS